MLGYIYKTTNLANGKLYIGQHKNAQYNPKYFGSGKLILRAIEKYGIENFANEMIHVCHTKEEMQDMERHYIAEYQSFPRTGKGYNLTAGGEWGDVTYGMNEEQYEEYCQKFRGSNNPMYGTHHPATKERIEKMVATRKRLGIGAGENNPMYKSGERGFHPLLGSKMSRETKDKISNSLKGNIPWNKGMKFESSKPIPTYDELYMANKCKKPIKVTNVDTRDIHYYESRNECEKHFKGVKYRLSQGGIIEGESFLFERVTKEEYLNCRNEVMDFEQTKKTCRFEGWKK